MDKEKVLSQLYQDFQVQLSNSPYSEKRLVLGGGSPEAILVMVGEAPGANEEAQGKVFVGSAGKNLTEFLEVLSLERDSIYITNTVKFRPSKINPKSGRTVNRPPTRQEIEFCKPLLLEELDVISPKVIVPLGNTALQAILNHAKALIGDLHGKKQPWKQGVVFPLYHPAAIIYNQKLKDTYHNDLKALSAYLKEIR